MSAGWWSYGERWVSIRLLLAPTEQVCFPSQWLSLNGPIQGRPFEPSIAKLATTRHKKNPRTWVVFYRLIDGPLLEPRKAKDGEGGKNAMGTRGTRARRRLGCAGSAFCVSQEV